VREVKHDLVAWNTTKDVPGAIHHVQDQKSNVLTWKENRECLT
jgi:hypothetical protein